MLFRYTVEFYVEDGTADLYPNASPTGLVKENGIIAGTTWGEAANRLAEYYGEGNLLEVSFYELENPLCDDEIKDMMVQK